MNSQTLNRMIKASYYAPNGAQLRKACYGLLSVNSRKASENPMVVLNQLEQLPEKEQTRIKADIVSKALIQSSEEAQAKLAPYGLKDVKNFMAQNQLTPEVIQKESKNVDPMIKKIVEEQASTPKEAVQLASNIIRSRTFEDLAGYLDVPVDWLQTKIENINYFKIAVCIIVVLIIVSFVATVYSGDLTVGEAILGAMYAHYKILAVPLIIYFFFGKIINWIQKRFNMILGWVVLAIPRIIVTIFKGMGWIMDSVIDGIKSSFSKFFSRQANIAMQSPEFRRAYYSI